jgi:hypothetical protein
VASRGSAGRELHGAEGGDLFQDRLAGDGVAERVLQEVSISEPMMIRKKLLIALDQDARQQAEGSAGEAITAKAAAMASQPASPGRQNTSSTAAVQPATPAATMAMAAVLAAIRVGCR